MDTVVLAAEKRKVAGRRANQFLRRRGRIPAIIYGHKLDPEPISLPAAELIHALKHGSRAMTVTVGKSEETVLIKDVQYDHLGMEPLHLDLARVDMNERIHTRVPIDYRGTPKGAHEGGQLDYHIVDIEIECLAAQIPENIVVRVDELGVGDALHIRDVRVGEGIKLLGHEDDMICTVRLMAAAVSAGGAGETEEESTAAEPEVIGRGKGDDEKTEV